MHAARKRHSVSYESPKYAMNGVTEQLQKARWCTMRERRICQGLLVDDAFQIVIKLRSHIIMAIQYKSLT